MIIEIHPTQLRETIPITLKISDVNEIPKIYIPSLGKVEVQGSNPYTARFWVQSPGDYKIVLSTSQKIVEKNIHVSPQSYLPFKKEFGLFSLLFFILLGGLVLWLKKLKRN